MINDQLHERLKKAEEDRFHMLRHYLIAMRNVNIVTDKQFKKMMGKLRKESEKYGIFFSYSFDVCPNSISASLGRRSSLES